MDNVAREPQVNNRLQQIDRALDELEKAMSAYSQRLEPILSPPQPIIEGIKEAKPKAPSAPLAEKLENLRDRVRGMVDLINTLSNRTEI